MTRSNQIAEDISEASSICTKFKMLECLQAAAALMNRFGDQGTVLYVDTGNFALRPFITHDLYPDLTITETGLHFAVEIHGLIFDNLHPNGEDPQRWMRSFDFAGKNWDTKTFEDIPIERWDKKKFLSYLKKCGRTPLGKPSMPRQPSQEMREWMAAAKKSRAKR